MKNKKITRKISQGVYALTTSGGGCIVDAVSQISTGDNPLIAVAVMKQNYTHELMQKNKFFAISVLGHENGEIIKTFGLNSMRDIDKFADANIDEINGVNILKNSLGYMVCEIIDKIENDTHTLFIGKLIEGDVLKEGKVLTYSYYQEHKDELLKVTTEKGKTAWVCMLCGYVYYGEALPNDFVCPLCGASADSFEKKS